MTWIEYPDEKEVGVATGFAYDHAGSIYLITNKHALTHDKSREWAHLASFVRWKSHVSDRTGSVQDGLYELLRVVLNRESVIWPNKDIDLCAIRLNGTVTLVPSTPTTGSMCGGDGDGDGDADESGPYLVCFGEGHICQSPKRDIVGFEAVTSIGFPGDAWCSVNNLPLTLSGSFAFPPSVDYLGAPHGLVQMPCYGGSSGSPLYVAPTCRQYKPYRNISESAGLHGGSILILVGVVFGELTEHLKGKVVYRPPPSTSVDQQHQGPSLSFVGVETESLRSVHLSEYIKASEIKEMMERAPPASTTPGANYVQVLYQTLPVIFNF